MGKVHALFADASAPDLTPELETRLAAALSAEAAARREHGAACLAREQGGTADTDVTADRLRAAVARRQDVEAAIEAARLAVSATEAEREAAAERAAWARASALLDQRADAVAALQRAADAFADALLAVHAVTGEVWAALPRRPAYTTSAWCSMARAAALYVYGQTDGAFGVSGTPESPYIARTTRPDLVAQAATDRDIIEGLRRD